MFTLPLFKDMSSQMSSRTTTKCFFIDVDDTLVKRGTEQELEPGIFARVSALVDAGHQVWLYTCRPPAGMWVQSVKAQGLKFHGIIHKPLADEYFYADDKFRGGAASLSELLQDHCPPTANESSPRRTWQTW